MFNPCYEHCYLRFGKQYTPDCDDKCEFAKVSKEKRELEEKIESLSPLNKECLQDEIINNKPIGEVKDVTVTTSGLFENLFRFR